MFLYTNAQKFYENNFIHDMFESLSPKSDYDIYSNDEFDLVQLKYWYLMGIEDIPMNIEQFNELVLKYFTNDVLSEIHKIYVRAELDNQKESPRFLVYKDYMFKQWIDGGTDHEERLLLSQLNLSLISVSDEYDVVTYRISIPTIHFDLMSGNFEEVNERIEIVEFIKTKEGWRMNSIPETYIE